MTRIRIYEPDAEPYDATLREHSRLIEANLIYFHEDHDNALDEGWYMRPGISWEACERVMAGERRPGTPTLEGLYDQANDLGEPLELSFWIERSNYGEHGRVCGEVLIGNDKDFGIRAIVCPEPWGTEHEHQA